MVLGLLTAMTSGSAAEIAHRLERLRSPVRVLYVAAHPDDENTQLLTWLSRGRKVRAAYLSLTRGDGGQNLIGPEQRPLLGVMRTHELLAARKLDGAEQLFTRLRDFGYSKSADESLKRWGEEFALSEVVYAFRSFRPHVVITRFPEVGDTHGHHLASAQLARRAMQAANDPKMFPEQLTRGLKPWKTHRLFYNFPHFFRRRGVMPPPDSKYEIDIGGYDSWLGQSYGEISALSRSMHKSQGFGASARIGPWKETLVLLEGSRPQQDDPLSGLPTWMTVPGGGPFAEAIEQANRAMDGRLPSAVIPWLGKAHKATEGIKDPILREELRAAVESLLIDAAGLHLEARTESAEVEPGARVSIEVQALARTPGASVVLRKVSGPGFEDIPRMVLDGKNVYRFQASVEADASMGPTRPHWLEVPATPARYMSPEIDHAQQPTVPAPFQVAFEVGIGGVGVRAERPIQRHWVDPVEGERTEALEVAPAVSVTPEVGVVVVPKGRGQSLSVEVRAGPRGFSGTIGWQGADGAITPERQRATLKPGAVTRLEFQVLGSLRARSSVRGTFAGDGKKPQPAWTRQVIDHSHISRMTYRSPSAVELVPAELSVPEGLFGYVPGSGDVVAPILARLGLNLETLDDQALLNGELNRFRAILLGIRAFNVNQSLLRARDKLMNYVRQGGTLVVQYNTKNWSSKLDVAFGPYPISISRLRVTDEGASVNILAPEHFLLTTPHQITNKDFDGWIQERGLYFAESWNKAYIPLFSMNDPGESPCEGSTLYAPYGKGHYIFSGLSFFRQLPAGNAGALRLLINFLEASRSQGEKS